jgi:L-cysteine:1D-myo-inositol 2-amino-2-deoxy-alpha-D-glucopyranoside ligase
VKFVDHWMHTALISKDGEKMSKSLGNLVFIDALREEWDPRAIRLGIISHHYRTEWEWSDELMPLSTERLAGWIESINGEVDEGVLEGVRQALDNDLDTPTACQLIDAAVAAGKNVVAAAALLGIELRAA